jgi:hypothetical protein
MQEQVHQRVREGRRQVLFGVRQSRQDVEMVLHQAAERQGKGRGITAPQFALAKPVFHDFADRLEPPPAQVGEE